MPRGPYGQAGPDRSIESPLAAWLRRMSFPFRTVGLTVTLLGVLGLAISLFAVIAIREGLLVGELTRPLGFGTVVVVLFGAHAALRGRKRPSRALVLLSAALGLATTASVLLPGAPGNRRPEPPYDPGWAYAVRGGQDEPLPPHLIAAPEGLRASMDGFYFAGSFHLDVTVRNEAASPVTLGVGMRIVITDATGNRLGDEPPRRCQGRAPGGTLERGEECKVSLTRHADPDVKALRSLEVEIVGLERDGRPVPLAAKLDAAIP